MVTSASLICHLISLIKVSNYWKSKIVTVQAYERATVIKVIGLVCFTYGDSLIEVSTQSRVELMAKRKRKARVEHLKAGIRETYDMVDVVEGVR